MKVIPLDELGRLPRKGEKVKIVREWVKSYHGRSRWNHDGYMDGYLGSCLTVRNVHNKHSDDWWLEMFEDKYDSHAPGDGWSWFQEMIAGVVIEEVDLADNTADWNADLSVLGFA